MKYDLDFVKSLYDEDNKIDILPFWKGTKAKELDKRCLTQWFVSPFIMNDIVFHTAEHYMMFHKAMLFNDIEIAMRILEDKSPYNAQVFGRRVKNYNDDKWNEIRYKVVVEGNFHKFFQFTELSQFLISTGDKIIVEASPIDKIWGVGLEEIDERINNPYYWKGNNLLGFALMEVRDILK